jgi:2-amino-4-hydroxy-6-hydroxymethyldihydropteridine diphosphokinase
MGDRLENLRAAVAGLSREAGVAVERCSSVYETEPVGEVLDQQDFLNAVVAVQTDLAPLELLAVCKGIERELGRRAGPRHGPRPIDIDVLLVGDAVLDSPRLRLPHPEVTARRFVLVPLLELEPQLELPGGGRLSAALEALPRGQRVERAGDLG